MYQASPFPRWKIAVVCIVVLLVMAYIDYVTGFELVFSAAYLAPVCLCAWFFSRQTIWLMCIASGLASWFADKHHPYSHFIFQYLNSFASFLICLMAGLLLHRFKQMLAEREQMNQDLQRALEKLKLSTEEITKLQNGLQVVCAWTHQIKVGDKWMTPDEFLMTQLHLKITHGMSPEASHKFEQEIRQTTRSGVKSSGMTSGQLWGLP